MLYCSGAHDRCDVLPVCTLCYDVHAVWVLTRLHQLLCTVWNAASTLNKMHHQHLLIVHLPCLFPPHSCAISDASAPAHSMPVVCSLPDTHTHTHTQLRSLRCAPWFPEYYKMRLRKGDPALQVWSDVPIHSCVCVSVCACVRACVLACVHVLCVCHCVCTRAVLPVMLHAQAQSASTPPLKTSQNFTANVICCRTLYAFKCSYKCTSHLCQL